MDLFGERKIKFEDQPLSLRMAPLTLDEFVGQDQVLGEGKLLRRSILADRITSLIIYGPSGTGKSAIARIIAKRTSAYFVELNAVSAGVSDIRKEVESAKERYRISQKKTILQVDEIHHFNRTQQDALLPDVEKGNIILIGITTENPFFYINSALLSRSLAVEFFRLKSEHITQIISNSLSDQERGLGKIKVKMYPDALEHIIKSSEGDARRALNALEIGVLTTSLSQDETVHFTLSVAEESLQRKVVAYDKHSDEHYDTISAYIKSIRGSNPDAALYWMTKMLYAGEDPRFVARRMVIAASEDIGNADPQALTIAVSAFRAVEFVGMPEARIPLAQATVYLACAPKSNAAYLALEKAWKEVETIGTMPVPNHLKDANLDGEKRGHGAGYKYPHSFPGHFVAQDYLPENKLFYEPTNQGYETEISKRLDLWRKETASQNQKNKFSEKK